MIFSQKSRHILLPICMLISLMHHSADAQEQDQVRNYQEIQSTARKSFIHVLNQASQTVEPVDDPVPNPTQQDFFIRTGIHLCANSGAAKFLAENEASFPHLKKELRKLIH